jgi:hypothetical protein
MSAFIGLLALDIVVAVEWAMHAERGARLLHSVACGIRLLGVFHSLGVSTANAMAISLRYADTVKIIHVILLLISYGGKIL